MEITILRDTREQLPWDFSGLPVTTEDKTLTTGDYTLREFCDHDQKNDTYEPHYAIERKSGDDFIRSITRNRGRFKQEIKRASDWPSELIVIIEEPKEPSRYQDPWLKPFDITRSQVFGTVDSWERYYNVNFRFAGSRDKAQRVTFDCLYHELQSRLL